MSHKEDLMKLYACHGTCSLAVHIALLELQIPHQIQTVDLRKGEGLSEEFQDINPLGQVPVLVTDDDEILTEVSAILVYLFQQHGQMDVPMYQCVRHLSFISTEMHANF